MPMYNGKIVSKEELARLQKEEKANKKADKKAKTEELLDARKSGDNNKAQALKEELSAASSAAKMSSAEVFEMNTLNVIDSKHKHDFTFFRVLRKADWQEDSDMIHKYISSNLHFSDKDAPAENELNLFVVEATFRQWNAGMKTTSVTKIVEVHPELCKKSGKVAIEIPDNSLVAVQEVSNFAQRETAIYGLGSSHKGLRQVTINHSYIFCVVPKHREAELEAHNMEDSRKRVGNYDID